MVIEIHAHDTVKKARLVSNHGADGKMKLYARIDLVKGQEQKTALA